jgi:hypothetical protein
VCAASQSLASSLSLHDDAQQRREAPGVGARLDRQVIVGHGRGFAAPWVDDNELARRVLLDLFEDDAGAGEAMRLPGVLADEQCHLGVLEVRMRAAGEHLALHPKLAGFFLRQCIRAPGLAQGLEKGVGVHAAQMVALAATAVVDDAFVAVPGTDGLELVGDFANRHLPRDGLIAAIWTPAHRRSKSVSAILIEVEPLRLFAQVAL